MSSQPPLSRRDLEALLIAKAWKDEAFAQELRTDPRAAIERELAQRGMALKLPDTLNVNVLEETPQTLYLVVPQKPANLQGSLAELSDEDLAAVAGGTKCTDEDTGCWLLSCIFSTGGW